MDHLLSMEIQDALATLSLFSFQGTLHMGL